MPKLYKFNTDVKQLNVFLNRSLNT